MDDGHNALTPFDSTLQSLHIFGLPPIVLRAGNHRGRSKLFAHCLGKIDQQHLARSMPVAPRSSPSPQGPRRSILVESPGLLTGTGAMDMTMAFHIVIRPQNARERTHHLWMRKHLLQSRNHLIDRIAGICTVLAGGAGLLADIPMYPSIDIGIQDMIAPSDKPGYFLIAK